MGGGGVVGVGEEEDVRGGSLSLSLSFSFSFSFFSVFSFVLDCFLEGGGVGSIGFLQARQKRGGGGRVRGRVKLCWVEEGYEEDE